MGNKNNIKSYFYISDGYRYHVLTQDTELFKHWLEVYLLAVTKREKENSYSFGRVDLSASRYNIYVKETQHYQKKEKEVIQEDNKKENPFTLIEENPDA